MVELLTYGVVTVAVLIAAALGFMHWASQFKDDHEQDEHEGMR